MMSDEAYENTEEYLQYWRANKRYTKEQEEYNDMMRHEL